MVESNFHDDGGDRDLAIGENSDPQELRQKLLTKLIELDFAYEREFVEIRRSSTDASSTDRLLKNLKEQHRHRRQFLIEKLVCLQQHASTDIPRPANNATASALSAQEANILRLLKGGAQVGEVAAQLGLDSATVKDAIKTILKKVSPRGPRLSLVEEADKKD